MAENYPVLDEELMSKREREYLRRDFESYGRDDAIEALAENGSDLVDEFGELREEYASIVEPYLFRLADSTVAYSGELYFGYSSKSDDYENWSSLKYALGEVTGGWETFLTVPELIEDFDTMVRHEKLEAERVEFEKHQKPIEGMEV